MKLTEDAWLAPRYGWTKAEYLEAVARGAQRPVPEPPAVSPMGDASEGVATLMAAVGRPSWHARALCRDVPTATFFSDSEASLERARQVCARCPVAPECLAAAEHGDEWGTWAGATRGDRKTRRATAA